MEGMAINRHYPLYAAAKKWEEALEIASALIQNCPENALGWIDYGAHSACTRSTAPPRPGTTS